MNRGRNNIIRKLIYSALASSIVFCSSVHANLLQNPGFEDGMAHWQMVYGSAQLTDWSRSGGYAMQMADTSRIQQIGIPVNQNTNYRLWMWASSRGGSSYPSNVHYLMWVNDSLIYEETNGSIGPWWTGKSVDFNTGNAETLSVSFSCYWSTANNGMVLDDIILVEEDITTPIMLSAEAFDNEAIVPGIDNEDYVVIAFSEPMNKAKLCGNEGPDNYIDSVLVLSNNHTWLNQYNIAGEIQWNETGDSLYIFFVTGYPMASVVPGDSITTNGITICDEWGNTVTNKVVISGSFGGEYGYLEGDVFPYTYPPIPDSEGIKITIIASGQSDTTEIGTGEYFIENIVAGNQKVLASRYPFIPETLQVEVAPGETTTVDFFLNTYYIKPPFFTDFENNDEGFCGKVVGGYGYEWWRWISDTVNAYSGTKVWYHRATLGADRCSSFLYVPVIDLSSVTTCSLSFFHRINSILFGPLARTVQASRNAEVWDTLLSIPEELLDWQVNYLDLGDYLGDTIFVRYGFVGEGVNQDLWWIDDFSLSSTGGTGISTENINELFLFLNNPNPMKAEKTTISYTIPEMTEVRLKIYDSSGRFINTLVNKTQETGTYNIIWDCRDMSKKKVATGIYFLYLETDNETKIRKLVLLK